VASASASVEPSSTVEASYAVEASSTTVATMLGKNRHRATGDRDGRDYCAKESQKGGSRHWRLLRRGLPAHPPK
jgi:hypothetical protein